MSTYEYNPSTGEQILIAGGASGRAKSTSVASVFSSSTSYSINDYVIYNDELYKCIIAHTGTWNASDFSKTSVTDEFNSSGGGGDANLEKATYETSPATKAHSVGDYIYYNNTVYKVTSAIAIDDTITVGTNVTADTGLDVDTQMYIDGLPGTADAPLGEQHTVTGNPLSFTTDSAQVSNKSIVSLEPIQAGSGDPSPSNVRSIYGYDTVWIKSSRKNLVDNSAIKQGTPNTSRSDRCASNNVVHVKTGDIITLSRQSSTIDAGINLYLDIDKDITSYGTGWISSFPYTLTCPSEGNVCISYAKANHTDNIIPSDVASAQFQLELGDEATEYEPYNPATDITIPAPDGTIYGGTLDVESGELVVDRISYKVSDLTWTTESIGNIIRMVSSSISSDVEHWPTEVGGNNYLTTGISEKYKASTVNRIYQESENGCFGVSYNPFIVLYDSRYTSASDFVANEGNTRFVLPLMITKTYHLSPHQVKLLTGHNIVTTNGTSMQLTYRKGEIAGLSDLSGLAESVEGAGDRIDALSNRISSNTRASYVDLTSITPYITPNDGYLMIKSATTSSNGIISYYVTPSNSTNTLARIAFMESSSANAEYSSVFIRKGMKITKETQTGNSEAHYVVLN